MKNLLLIFVLILGSSNLFAQSVTLELGGISGSAIPVKSANLEMVRMKDTRGQMTDAIVYVVTRNQNNLSGTIMSAIKTKKSLQKGVLTVTLKNGQKITHDLGTVVISNYMSKNMAGKTPTEQFYMICQNDVIRK